MANDSEILASGEKTSQQTQKYFPSGKDKEIEKGDFCVLTWQRFMKYFKNSWMKNLWEEEDFCKIFAFAEENKLPFLQGWEFLQREELEQDNGPGQKVS